MKRIVVFCLLLLSLAGCAKIVLPTGGPKDTTPPVVTKEVPANRSTLFNSKSIKISFNEFVVLNNPNKTVIVSPPFAEAPELEIVNKSVVIHLPDSLRANTTYSIALAETIKDYTEGNPISIYEYTFSTGSNIDSFMLKGSVSDALSLEKVKDVFVFLYKDDIDSLPLTTRPDHLTKTNGSGQFVFNNIKPGKYKIFALDDINNNLVYDLPNEKIAFSNELVESWAMPTPADSNRKDSVQADVSSKSAEEHAKIELVLFTERDTNQALLKYINTTENIYQFPYKTDFKEFSARHLAGQELDYFQLIAPTQDTVLWYLKTALTDTALYEFTTDQKHIDSVKITQFKKSQKPGGNRGKKQEDEKKLNVNFDNKGNIFKPLTLLFSYPIKPAEDVPFTIIKQNKNGNDTVTQTLSIPDTFVTSLPIDYTFEAKTKYIICIRDSVFLGYNGSCNDSINTSFTTKTEKDYGNLLMHYHISDPSCQYVVQLLNKNKTILQENILSQSQSIEYAHLEPGSYQVKVIKDQNNNGRWDTGMYRDKIQPESIFFFPSTINIRGYWDFEEDFELK